MIRRGLGPSIKITSHAVKKMIEIVQKKNAFGFLFSANGGGCHGFHYHLRLIDQSDSILQKKVKPPLISSGDPKVFVDPMSEMLLLGTTIDYVFEDYDKGVFENKFIFIPDSELSTSCGCGKSFTPKA